MERNSEMAEEQGVFVLLSETFSDHLMYSSKESFMNDFVTWSICFRKVTLIT